MSSSSSSSSSSSVPARFSGRSFYEIFSIEKSSTTDIITKAYRKLALSVHPDRNNTPSANEEFQYISHGYQILSNPHTRQLYDRHGSIDAVTDAEQSGSADTMEAAIAMFRQMFPELDKQKIDDFEKEYVGSEMEIEDIISGYQLSPSLAKLIDAVPYAKSSDLRRYAGILQQRKGIKFTERQINDAIKKAEKQEKLYAEEFEKKQAEEEGKEEEEDADKENNDSSPKKRRKKNNNSKADSSSSSASLIAAIRSKNPFSGDAFAAFAEKYSQMEKGAGGLSDNENNDNNEYAIDEDEFQRIQKEVMDRAAKGKAAGGKKAAAGAGKKSRASRK